MRIATSLSALLLLCLLFTALAAGAAPPATQAAEPSEQQKINIAVAQLADPDPQVREKATKFLWSVGKAAEAALEEAAATGDPEMATRAREVLLELRSGIRPDMPPEMLQQIRVYRGATPAQKAQCAVRLFQMGKAAYPVIVKLSNAEPTEKVRIQAFRYAAQQGMALARASLTRASYDQAETMLELATSDGGDPAARSYAAFLLQRGHLDAAIAPLREQVALSSTKCGAAKTLAYLYRAAGDLKSASWAAQRSDDPALLEAILYEQGDWKLLANVVRQRLGANPEFEQLAFLAAYERLAGNANEFKNVLVQLRSFPQNADFGNWPIAKALFLNDCPDEAIGLLVSARNFDEALQIRAAQHRYADAIALADQAAGADPAEAMRSRIQLGRIMCELGQAKKATEVFDKVADEAEKRSDAATLGVLIMTENAAGLRDRALAHASNALDQKIGDAGLAASLFRPEDSTDVACWWEFLQRKFPGEKPSGLLSRLLGIMEHTLPAEQLDALAEELGRENPPAAPALPGVPQVVRAEPTKLRVAARTLLAAGREDAAHKLFGQIAERTAAPADWIEGGNLYARAGEWQRAIEFYDRARARDAASAAALYLHGWAMAHTDQKQRGQAAMEQAHLMALADERQHLAMAEALGRVGLQEEAARQYDIVRRTAPFRSWEQGFATERAAHVFQRHGEFLAAANMYEQALLRCLPSTAMLVDSRGYVLVPRLIHELRARGLVAAGQIDAALREADLAIAAVPGDSEIAICLVPELEKRGRKNSADELFKRVRDPLEQLCRDYPESPAAHNSLAWMLARCRRDLDTALTHANRGVELAPKNCAILDTLAEVHFQRGEKDKAAAAIRKCIELQPAVERHRLALKRFLEGTPDTPPPPE